MAILEALKQSGPGAGDRQLDDAIKAYTYLRNTWEPAHREVVEYVRSGKSDVSRGVMKYVLLLDSLSVELRRRRLL